MNNASDSCKTSNSPSLIPLDRNLEWSIQNPVPPHQTNEVYSIVVLQGSLGHKVLNQQRIRLLSILHETKGLIFPPVPMCVCFFASRCFFTISNKWTIQIKNSGSNSRGATHLWIFCGSSWSIFHIFPTWCFWFSASEDADLDSQLFPFKFISLSNLWWQKGI